MKVGYVIHTLAKGGAETQLLRHIRSSKSFVESQQVFYFSEPSTLKPDYEKAGAEVTKLPQPTLQNPLNILRSVRRLRQSECDILHTHLPEAHVIGRLASIHTSTPIVSTYHSLPDGDIQSALAGRLANYSKVLSTMNVGVSDTVTDAYRGQMGNWTTISNAINVDRFHNRVQKAPSIEKPTNGPLVLNVGRYVPVKRQSLFLKAIAEIRKSRPDIELGAIIVGWGDLEDELRRLAGELGVSDAVEITGETESVIPYYAAADVVGMTSAHEGFGLVAIEAMAAETPVVGTNSPGIREVIKDSPGQLVSDDIHSIADGIIEALEAEDAGADSYDFVSEEYDISRQSGEYFSLYNRLTAGQPPSDLSGVAFEIDR